MANQAYPSPKAAKPPQKQKLTDAPTNLKEAIDWVLRVTGRDGYDNKNCLCLLAKEVKDLLYDAGIQYSTESTTRQLPLLPKEREIVQRVLTDLGLDNATHNGCGSTEVIGTLIDHLALGLQKWVGWKDNGDECCLKGDKGIGRECKCTGTGGVSGCCGTGGSAATTCHECRTCGTGATGGPDNKCYLSAYCKKNGAASGSPPEGQYYWPTISSDPYKVHLLARIFLGSVCLIWSGLSQLGFLTGGSGGKDRWKDDTLNVVDSGLGSFMAAMGYDLERLNGSGGPGTGKTGTDVWKLLSGQAPDKNKGIQWKEFTGDSTNKESVAEYYSSIYEKAKEALKNKKTEEICKDYPLLVLHILASGYFRAGSAGANKVTPAPAKPAPSDSRKPRNPRTIREILYWLSALPYSQGYCGLVGRMQQKTDQVTQGNDNAKQGQIELYNESDSVVSTTLQQKDITHYLMAACGYCPLVLIGIQGTIEREVKTGAQAQGGSGSAGADQKKCPEHSKDRNKRCKLGKEGAQAQSQSTTTGQTLKEGQVCYGGYHLEVSKFGPLHGMYANGLFGFQMDGSPAQCLDQLRIYVYHCFYQLYFLRKQCSVGVEVGGGAGRAGSVVLGWQSCRYGYQVGKKSGGLNGKWMCEIKDGGVPGVGVPGVGVPGAGDQHTKNCGLQNGAQTVNESALQSFLCDSIHGMNCQRTVGSGVDKYPEIDAHMNKTVDSNGKQHEPHKNYPQLCPVPMGWSMDGSTATTGENHFKDLKDTHKQESLQPAGVGNPGADKYPAHCTGRTLSHLLEYYCDPEKCHGTLVVLLRLLACITPTVPRTLGDLFGFYYYIVYIGGKNSGGGGGKEVYQRLTANEKEVVLYMGKDNEVVSALTTWSTGGDCSGKNDTLKCLYKCTTGTGQCCQYLSPLSGQQYGQLSPAMAGTYLSWLVYLIEEFQGGLEKLKGEFQGIDCKDGCNRGTAGGTVGCGDTCTRGTHGDKCEGGKGGVCGCTSVVSCTGVLPVLYKYGFGYGNVTELHKGKGPKKRCHEFLGTLTNVKASTEFQKLTTSINQLIYTTRLPWIFVLTLAWLVAVLYLAFGAIWPLDWTHMRSHCRGWFRKGSGSTPWEVLMVGKKKGRGILEFFGTGQKKKQCHDFLTTLESVLKGNHLKNGSSTGLHHLH